MLINVWNLQYFVQNVQANRNVRNIENFDNLPNVLNVWDLQHFRNVRNDGNVRNVIPRYFVQMACDDIRWSSNYQYYSLLSDVMFVGNLLKMNWTKSGVMRMVYC